MPCLRFDLHRSLPLYLDRAATPSLVARLERHLLACGACRARLVRLRDAKQLLGELPRLEAPSFERLMARPPVRAARAAWSVPPLVRHFAADALVASGMFVAFTFLYSHTASARNRAFDTSSFRRVSVRDVAGSHDPHVIVQGVVSHIDGDFDEGSHRFRLSDPDDPKAFVVCEVIDGTIPPPKPGARVRVWGVSRYDSKPDHRWFEIHPVLKAEVLK